MKFLKILIFVSVLLISQSAFAAFNLNVGGGAFIPTGDLNYKTCPMVTAGIMFSLESKYNFSTGFQVEYAYSEHEDDSDDELEMIKITQFLRQDIGKGIFIKGGFSIYRLKWDGPTGHWTGYEPGFSIGCGASLMNHLELNAVYNIMIDNEGNGSNPDFGDNYWGVTLSVLY